MRRLLAIAVLVGGGGLAASAAATAPVYGLAATQSCLAARPNAVAGLPPATPPRPPALFVFPLARHPAGVRQLGVWYGRRSYGSLVLGFFRSVAAARASSKTLAAPSVGTRARNVVATWERGQAPTGAVRASVLACLRSGAGPAGPRTSPAATLATFAGRWGGHTRELAVDPTGRGRESVDDGCCTRVYASSFRILSVHGTLTRAVAVYRVTAFRRYDPSVRRVRPGAVGTLLLRNGIVTNALTGQVFCSDPAWGATGACGA